MKVEGIVLRMQFFNFSTLPYQIFALRMFVCSGVYDYISRMFPSARLLSSIMSKIFDVIHSFLSTFFLYPSVFSTAFLMFRIGPRYFHLHRC